MARMLPRRLGHEEEASLVEHLTELRHRLFICLGSIVPAFALAYAFHDHLIERLKDLLPPGTPLVTFGVTEPFLTSLKVSFYAAIALVLPIILWQVWSFLAPAVGRTHSVCSACSSFSRPRSSPPEWRSATSSSSRRR